MKLTKKELSCVLEALRYFQRDIEDGEPLKDNEGRKVSAKFIDKLCEKINQ